MARRLPTWLNASERRQLLKASLAAREWAVICTFIYAGLRSNELSMLDIRDLDFEEMTLFVRFGKRAKQRVVPLHAEAAAAIDAYLEGRTDGPVFLSSRGGRLSNRRLRSLVKEIGGQAGLVKELHPHALRHTFAVSLLDAGEDLETIRDLLGHESIQTTSIYLHCSVAKRRAAIDAL